MRNPLNIIKKGICKMKEKFIDKVVGIGTALKDRENRAIIGMVTTSLGIGLMASAYIKLPQQI